MILKMLKIKIGKLTYIKKQNELRSESNLLSSK